MITKKFKKVAILATVISALTATSVYAATQGQYFSYKNYTAYASLVTNWHISTDDTAKAKTIHSNYKKDPNYKVTVYLEAPNTKRQPVFDSDYIIAERDINVPAQQFNSSHAIAKSGNVYNSMNYTHLSDD